MRRQIGFLLLSSDSAYLRLSPAYSRLRVFDRFH